MMQKKGAKGKLEFDAEENPIVVGSGYFWISYCDMSITTAEAFEFEMVQSPIVIDQHDYMPVTTLTADKDMGIESMANVFEAQYSQSIAGISCRTPRADCDAHYGIYLLRRNFTSPVDGLKVAQGGGQCAHSGFHRFLLSSQVSVQKGQFYSVVMTMRSGGEYIASVPIGLCFPGVINQKSVVLEKASYALRSGIRSDFKKIFEDQIAEKSRSPILGVKAYYDNFPIKAYAVRQSGDLAMKLSTFGNALCLLDGHNTMTVVLSFAGISLFDVGSPAITWAVLPGYEDIAEIAVIEGAGVTLAVIIAKKSRKGHAFRYGREHRNNGFQHRSSGFVPCKGNRS